MRRDRRARVCPTEWPDHRDSRGSSMHAGLGRKEWRPGWLVVAKRPDPVERMKMDGEEKRKRLSSSKLLAKLRLFKVWRKDSLGVAPGSLGIPFSGTPPVENHFLAPHCRELETFRWAFFSSAFLFLSMSCPFTIPSNPPPSSPTAVHQRATNSSPDIKA